MTARAGSPPAVRTAGACPHCCCQLINVPVEVIYVTVTCSFFFLLLQQFVSKRLSLNQGPAAAWDKGGGGDLAHQRCGGDRLPCAGTVSPGTTELLQAMGHILTPGVLFTMAFEELLLST